MVSNLELLQKSADTETLIWCMDCSFFQGKVISLTSEKVKIYDTIRNKVQFIFLDNILSVEVKE
jgi:hypothetical protein